MNEITKDLKHIRVFIKSVFPLSANEHKTLETVHYHTLQTITLFNVHEQPLKSFGLLPPHLSFNIYLFV